MFRLLLVLFRSCLRLDPKISRQLLLFLKGRMTMIPSRRSLKGKVDIDKKNIRIVVLVLVAFIVISVPQYYSSMKELSYADYYKTMAPAVPSVVTHNGGRHSMGSQTQSESVGHSPGQGLKPSVPANAGQLCCQQEAGGIRKRRR